MSTTYQVAKRVTLASANTTVQTLSSSLLTPTGLATMTALDIVVKSGQLNYAFTHNPLVDPDTALADTDAAFVILPADGVVRIEGAANLANLRYIQTGDTEAYFALGA